MEWLHSKLSPFIVHCFVTFILNLNLDITVKIVAYTADGILSQTDLTNNMSAVYFGFYSLGERKYL